MLQAGHVVVVYGVDDGLHHEGVFLVLDRWERQLLFYCSQGDLILWTLILWILSITCPPKSLFHLYSCMNTHRNKQAFLLHLQFKFKLYQELFSFLPVTCDPITLSRTAQKSAVTLRCTKRRGGERQGGEEERRWEERRREPRLMWRLFCQAWHPSYIPRHNLPAGGAVTKPPQRAANTTQIWTSSKPPAGDSSSTRSFGDFSHREIVIHVTGWRGFTNIAYILIF